VFGQNHLFVKIPSYKGFCYSEEFQKILSTSQKISSSLSAVQTPICLLFHPSGRRTLPSRRQSDQESSARTTCIFRPDLYCIEKLLFHHVSVRTYQQPVWTPLSDRSASNSFQVQNKGRLIYPSGRCGFPSGRAHT
jgi:hypothetical protein